MKIGKYTLSDWIDTESSLTSIVYKRKITTTAERGAINIHLAIACPEPNIFINTNINFINDVYRLMYNRSIHVMDFNTIEEAKQHADDFLNKLQRLKAFI